MHHELRSILENDERFDEEFISNIFKDVENSNEFTTKEAFEKNDSKVGVEVGQELKNKNIIKEDDEDLEKLPPSKKVTKIDEEIENPAKKFTDDSTKYYSALDSTVSQNIQKDAIFRKAAASLFASKSKINIYVKKLQFPAMRAKKGRMSQSEILGNFWEFRFRTLIVWF